MSINKIRSLMQFLIKLQLYNICPGDPTRPYTLHSHQQFCSDHCGQQTIVESNIYLLMFLILRVLLTGY